MLYAVIRQMKQTLSNLAVFLDEGAKLAEAKGFDVANLLNARLAPDMFTLIRQVQSACDTAKFAPARLAGKDAPSHPDTETTLDELRARIGQTIEFIASFEEADFEGAADRELTLNFLPLPIRAQDYLIQFAVPNFFFHVTTAYAILRHNGVTLGKRTFIGHVDLIGAEG